MARARLLSAAALLLALLTLALASRASSASASGGRETHEDGKALAESDDVAHVQPGVLCSAMLNSRSELIRYL